MKRLFQKLVLFCICISISAVPVSEITDRKNSKIGKIKIFEIDCFNDTDDFKDMLPSNVGAFYTSSKFLELVFNKKIDYQEFLSYPFYLGTSSFSEKEIKMIQSEIEKKMDKKNELLYVIGMRIARFDSIQNLDVFYDLLKIESKNFRDYIKQNSDQLYILGMRVSLYSDRVRSGVDFENFLFLLIYEEKKWKIKAFYYSAPHNS